MNFVNDHKWVIYFKIIQLYEIYSWFLLFPGEEQVFWTLEECIEGKGG